MSLHTYVYEENGISGVIHTRHPQNRKNLFLATTTYRYTTAGNAVLQLIVDQKKIRLPSRLKDVSGLNVVH